MRGGIEKAFAGRKVVIGRCAHLTEPRVGHTHHLGGGDRGMREQRLLDLAAQIEISATQSDGELQAEVTVTAPPETLSLLSSLGDDLRFVLITSAAQLRSGDELAVQVTPSSHSKCERCWHWRDDVGHDSAHPTLCGRCTSNLYGAGEPRSVA